MERKSLALVLLLLMAMPVFAADSAVTQVARGLAAIPSQLNFSTILANSQTADIIKAACSQAGGEVKVVRFARYTLGE